MQLFKIEGVWYFIVFAEVGLDSKKCCIKMHIIMKWWHMRWDTVIFDYKLLLTFTIYHLKLLTSNDKIFESCSNNSIRGNIWMHVLSNDLGKNLILDIDIRSYWCKKSKFVIFCDTKINHKGINLTLQFGKFQFYKL